jgi:hypothetical protein
MVYATPGATRTEQRSTTADVRLYWAFLQHAQQQQIFMPKTQLVPHQKMMHSGGMNAEAIRKTVSLAPDERDIVNAARTEGSPAHDALVELAGPDAIRSETATIQSLIHLGARVLRERVQQHGYAALAASQDDEDRAYYAAMRARPRGLED